MPDLWAFVLWSLQAVWRGHALRSRLALALAAAAAAGTDLGDEGLEEVDMDEFVFDEVGTDTQVTHTHTPSQAQVCTLKATHMDTHTHISMCG